MSVVIAFEETGPCRKKLTIEVPAPAVEAEMGRVAGDYRKQIQLPGFRKGKAPMGLVQRRFKVEIEKEVADRLVPRYWHQAQAEKSLDPLLPPQVEEVSIEPGEPMKFVALVETRPEIPVADLSDLELPTGEPEPREDEIEDALRDLRRQHASWTTVERPAATGDLVIGSMVPADAPEAEGEDDAEGESADAPRPIHVELGASGIDEKLTLALTGATAGHKVKYTREEPGEEEGETSERDYRIEVTEVKEQELPELDDELAQRFGLESAAELQEKMVENLRANKERDLRVQREQKLLQELRDRHPLELPEGLVQHESEQMVHDYLHQLSSQGIDVEKAPINWEALLSDVKPRAENRVHERLVLDAVAEAQEIRLDESEFEKFLAGAAAEQKMSSLTLRQRLAENGRLETLRAQMLRAQTVRQLLGEEPADEDGEGEASAESADVPTESSEEE